MSHRSLTIILPVYNGESRLAEQAQQVLELASDLTPEFSLMIVDDGSTDDTAVVAHQLASRFPQIELRRSRQRTGLGPIIQMARRQLASDVVVIHDGVTPIDAAQLRRLWMQSAGTQSTAVTSTLDVSELRQVRATHEAMAKAHDRMFGFHLLDRSAEAETRESTTTVAAAHRAHQPRPATHADRKGVGQIPPLPRPNFLSAVADFALGE